MTNFWHAFVFHGKVVFVLKENLKALKHHLRIWNHEVFGFLDLEVEKYVKLMNGLDYLVSSDFLGDQDQVEKITSRLPQRCGKLCYLRKAC